MDNLFILTSSPVQKSFCIKSEVAMTVVHPYKLYKSTGEIGIADAIIKLKYKGCITPFSLQHFALKQVITNMDKAEMEYVMDAIPHLPRDLHFSKWQSWLQSPKKGTQLIRAILAYINGEWFSKDYSYARDGHLVCYCPCWQEIQCSCKVCKPYKVLEKGIQCSGHKANCKFITK